MTPSAVIPYALQIRILKHGRLRIRRIGFSILLYQNPSTGKNQLRPAQIEHPPNGVKNMYSHIADNAINVIHKRTQPASMRKPVIRTKSLLPGPQVIIERL